jgi:hypothetical protein
MSENARIRQDLASISQQREEALARAEAAMQERHKAEKTIVQLEAQLKGSSKGGQYGTLGAAAGGGGVGRSPGLESVDEEHAEEVWLRERLEESEKEGERLRADLEQSKKLWDEGSQIWHEAEKEIQETKEELERLVAVADAAERARCDALEQASADRRLLESLREQVQHDQEVSRKIVETVKAENVRLERERRYVEELHRADKDKCVRFNASNLYFLVFIPCLPPCLSPSISILVTPNTVPFQLHQPDLCGEDGTTRRRDADQDRSNRGRGHEPLPSHSPPILTGPISLRLFSCFALQFGHAQETVCETV